MKAHLHEAYSTAHLHGRILISARILWLAVFLFCFVSFLAALPATLQQRQGFAQQSLGWSEADIRMSLDQLGLSYDAFVSSDVWSNLANSMIFFALGLFIFLRRSEDLTAYLFSLFFIIFPVTATFDVLAQQDPSWKVARAIFESLGSIAFLVLLIFPNGRFVPRWTRWVALFYALIQAWRLFQPEQYDSIQFLVTLPLLVCILLSQIYRYRRASTPLQKQQTKWVVFGLTAGFTPLLVYLLVFLSDPSYNLPGARGMAMFLLGNVVWSLSILSLFLSITFAIVRSGLWDIDIIIRRTLVYGGLTATLGLLYFGSVLVLQSVFQALTGEQRSPLVTVLSTLAIAASFSPLRRRIQENTDRRFYREKYDAQKTLESFAAGARSEVELEQLTDRLLLAVSETMQPEHLSLWVRPMKH